MIKAKSLYSNPVIIIPIVVFILAKIFYYFIAIKSNCNSPFSPVCWVRWDSGLYLQIAEFGHTLYPCTAAETTDPTMLGKWCGTSGWSPLYPLFIQCIGTIFSIKLATAALILSNIFFLGFLVVNAKLANIKRYDFSSFLVLLLVAFCPGNIFFHAVFPVSQAAFFIAFLFLFLKNQKYLLAGFCGLITVLTYPIGIFLFAILGMYGIAIFFIQHQHWKMYFFKTFMVSALAMPLLFIYDYWCTGHWNAMFLVQSKYGHSIQSPLKMFGIHLQRLMENPFTEESWIGVQTIFVSLMAIAMFIFTLARYRKTILGLLEALYVFVIWFGPMSVGAEVSMYRSAAFTGTSTRSLIGTSKILLCILLSIFVFFSYTMGLLYMTDRLV